MVFSFVDIFIAVTILSTRILTNIITLMIRKDLLELIALADVRVNVTRAQCIFYVPYKPFRVKTNESKGRPVLGHKRKLTYSKNC